MTRHKDACWDLPTPPGMGGAQIAVLMDIRDELKKLNDLLGCRNFINIPLSLNQIEENTRRRKRKEKVK